MLSTSIGFLEDGRRTPTKAPFESYMATDWKSRATREMPFLFSFASASSPTGRKVPQIFPLKSPLFSKLAIGNTSSSRLLLSSPSLVVPLVLIMLLLLLLLLLLTLSLLSLFVVSSAAAFGITVTLMELIDQSVWYIVTPPYRKGTFTDITLLSTSLPFSSRMDKLE